MPTITLFSLHQLGCRAHPHPVPSHPAQELEAARETYDEAIASGDTAYLLEQVSGTLFQMSLGNVAPKSRVTIEITYLAPLPIGMCFCGEKEGGGGLRWSRALIDGQHGNCVIAIWDKTSQSLDRVSPRGW